MAISQLKQVRNGKLVRNGYFSPVSPNTLEMQNFLSYFRTRKRPYFMPELRNILYHDISTYALKYNIYLCFYIKNQLSINLLNITDHIYEIRITVCCIIFTRVIIKYSNYINLLWKYILLIVIMGNYYLKKL